MKDNTKLIWIALLILLTWRLPLSEYLRFNMRLVFMWFVVLSLGFYIAATINVWFGAFLLVALIAAFNPNPTPHSGEALLMVILGSITYVIFYTIHDKEAVLTILCLFALANVFVVSIQVLGFDFQLTWNEKLMADDRTMRIGLLDNWNSLSASFAVCLPAFFRPKWKWFIPFVLFGLYLANSVGGVLASMPTILYYTVNGLKKYSNASNAMVVICSSLTVIVCLAAFVWYVDPPNYKSRWAAWRMYGVLSTDKHHNQLIGQGLGHWQPVFARKDVRHKICEWADCSTKRVGIYYAQAHNEYIQADWEMGAIGVAVIIGFLINTLRRVRSVIDPIPILIVLAFVVDSFVYFPFHIPTLALIGIMGFAMLERSLREKVC